MLGLRAAAPPSTARALPPDLAQRIGIWAQGFSPTSSHLARIKASLRDFVGCVAAGTAHEELTPAITLATAGRVPVWGMADSFDPAGAAVVVGCAGSLLQLHDFYGPGACHPSAPVIAAAWSTLHHVGGGPPDDFIGAVAAGYEAANRIAAACVPAQVLAGSSPNGTAGALGAAVAAAKIRGLKALGIGQAVTNAALLLPATPFAAMRAHGALVPLHSGLAGRAGYEAAGLARHAGAGHHILEGDAEGPGLIGLLSANPAFIEPERWNGGTIDQIGWKFFPACLATHVALEAVLRMDRIDPQEIDRVVVRRPGGPLESMVANGLGDGGLYDRLMSLRWVLACALHLGCYRYPDAVVDLPGITALARKFELVVEAHPNAATRGDSWTIVEIYTAGRLRSQIDYRHPVDADPTTPGPRGWTVTLDESALLDKFELLTAQVRIDPVQLAMIGVT